MSYRPLRFSDVLGQDIAVKLVKNALKLGKFPRTSIFYGPSGVGKTTIARLIAAWGVCIQKLEDVCGVCDMCKRVQNDSITDIVEFDAASNTGVEDIRALLEQCNYAPQFANEKIFITDEAHMLSRSAISALLKTFEETPDHIRFIMATTEIEKIPDSIRSRCFCIPLQAVKEEVIAQSLLSIAKSDDLELEAEGLELLVIAANGSLREAISIYRQCIMLSEKKITHKTIKSVLGFADKSEIEQITNDILGGEVSKIFLSVSSVLSSSIFPLSLLKQLRKKFKELFLERREERIVFSMIMLNELEENTLKNACAREGVEIGLAEIAYYNKNFASPNSSNNGNNELTKKAMQLFFDP